MSAVIFSPAVIPPTVFVTVKSLPIVVSNKDSGNVIIPAVCV